MYKNIFLMIGLILAKVAFSQGIKEDCNREVDVEEYKDKIIKEVCIPKGYVITMLYTYHSSIDLNGDGLGDFIFSYEKLQRQDGDSTFLSIYKKMPDSSYQFLKTFNNLFPVYLSSYSEEPKDTTLIPIFNCYDLRYPLLNMQLKDGCISLNLRIDAVSSYLLKYKFISKRNDWLLISFSELTELPDGSTESVNRTLPYKNESIDQFTYEKYICPNRDEMKE